jgi:hypothetical protein
MIPTSGRDEMGTRSARNLEGPIEITSVKRGFPNVAITLSHFFANTASDSIAVERAAAVNGTRHLAEQDDHFVAASK